MRPVVSMIGTPEYQLAKVLDGFIKPNIPKDFMLHSTSDFIDKLKLYSIHGNETMVSFDVSSLFTNVPLLETIDIVCDYAYSDNAITTPPFKREVFRKMLILCSKGMFIYNDDWYEQVDGVAMGSPLAPSLANMFLAHIECKLLQREHTPESFPKLYLRYVDDTFCLFECEEYYRSFLNTLNCLHPNLNFTVEVASSSMPFLDVNVRINSDAFETSVYRKHTHTGVFLHYLATAPTAWKKGLIFCLLYRAKMICSSMTLFLEEIGKLKRMFTLNGYSSKFFTTIYNDFMNPKPCDDSDILDSDSEDGSENTPICLLRVPYYGKSSRGFAKDLSELIESNFEVKIRVVYTTFKVGSFFQLKSRTPSTLLSNVVYKFTCAVSAHITYIGYTSRHLLT